jgi:site-specific DNA-methyltransferase (adenine-specific)
VILNANALAIPLADQSVQCVVTSPPYYGLRNYGVDGQIGLEVTPDEYIANLVAVFRECKRILRDDGILWVNIGDSYNGSAPNQSGQNGYNDGRENRDKRYSTGGVNGLKPKDLIGIPWMLAFALRADGWWLRQDIIWAKPNPMPESVKDRCTKSHEYLFLLTKSARYYYDSEAVSEPLRKSSIERGKYGWNGKTGGSLEMGATPSGGGFNKLKQSGEKLSELYSDNGSALRHVPRKVSRAVHTGRE